MSLPSIKWLIQLGKELLRMLEMDSNLNKIHTEVYTKCRLKISNFQIEPESKEYDACQFDLNGRKIISRNSKITHKKAGQFVTFWKRKGNGSIEPFEGNDQIDFYAVNVRMENVFGQFVLITLIDL